MRNPNTSASSISFAPAAKAKKPAVPLSEFGREMPDQPWTKTRLYP